ncbi:hypothetical protein NYR97_06110 [Xanthomonas hydrangeae]|uniref:N-acetyltransferase domain-containing protein n=1 Tax=Xanthomonas hydrangeae TaxID=2775159 RepID=A0AAU0BCY7_9XANT|nr:hypothetical protein [Xanthomonas hydrangeae]WOB50954.1 hypothetical protein NYR97_06110 [Xanthomonas hydrangeae]
MNIPISHSSKITFAGRSGQPYEFVPQHGFPASDCYGSEKDVAVCTFETMSLSTQALHVEHFAVTKAMAGRGYGERCLRDFAEMIQAQMPLVSEITFDLVRSLSGSDIARLAKAREALFQRLGAIQIGVRSPNQWCHVVSATWPRSSW